jgi:hypothetical protein
MPLPVSSSIAFLFLGRCDSPMPRSTFGAFLIGDVPAQANMPWNCGQPIRIENYKPPVCTENVVRMIW